MLQIIGITFMAICCSFMIKKDRPELQFCILILTCILITIHILEFVQSYVAELQGMQVYFQHEIPFIFILIKILGITYISELVSNICKDFGYATLSNQVEFFAKLCILAAGMPILKALFEAVTGIIQSS